MTNATEAFKSKIQGLSDEHLIDAGIYFYFDDSQPDEAFTLINEELFNRGDALYTEFIRITEEKEAA